jgi:hypothetical protein
MEIATSPSQSQSNGIDTPDVSLFVPSPVNCYEDARCTGDLSCNPRFVTGYSGLKLERYVIHQGRFGSDDDTSLLEAVIQSAFDDFKSVRVVAEGSESVHSFMGALSEDFLNCSEAVHVERVTITSPESGKYACVIEAIYPAIPRFRHLAKVYVGHSVSDRSVLEASLSAACNTMGQILLTFQPEGYKIPDPPAVDSSNQTWKEISPLPSTVDSPGGYCERGSSLFRPVFLADDSPKRRFRFSRFFTCGNAN